MPTAGSQPRGIVAAPDGAIWFAEGQGNKIGRITTGGNITEFAVPLANAQPWSITVGPDGALYFGEFGGGQIGRITTSGVFSGYTVPFAANNRVTVQLISITLGPDGNLWFADYGTFKFGQAVFQTAAMSATPPSGYYLSDLTFSGSGFAPNETVQIFGEGVGSRVLVTAMADNSGSFSVNARAPESAYGPRLFLSQGQSSGKVGAAGFSMNARLMLQPSSGAAGSTAAVAGYGFDAKSEVNVHWLNPITLLGKPVTNSRGSFAGSAALTFSVPAGSPAGPVGVYGFGFFTGTPTGPAGTAKFTVQ